MEKSTWKSWIRSTATVCAISMFLGILLPIMSDIKCITVYADSSNYTNTDWYPATKPVRVKTDKITLHLSEYNLPDREIHRERLNNTGVKILYDDGSWLYLHEYTNAENDYNMGMTEDKDVLNANHIVGFEVAPGYEAVLRDGTKLKNGEEHKTRILGPLRLLGRSEEEYLANENYKEEDGKKGSERDENGEYEIDPTNFQIPEKNKGGFEYKIASWEQFSKLWDYNWSDFLSKEHETEEDMDIDVRNDVKIFNIKSIMVKKTTLKEGVYLMRGAFNVLNGETEKDMEDTFNRGIFEYISPNIDEEDAEVIYRAEETKTNGSVNGMMVVGNYEVNIKRKRSKAVIGSEKETVEEYMIIRGSKNKAVVITDAWKLNYGFRGISGGVASYATGVLKGMLNAAGAYFESTWGLIGLITGDINISSPIDLVKGILIDMSIVGVVRGIFRFFKKAEETRKIRPYYNDFVELTITKCPDDEEKVPYSDCVYFKDESQEYVLTRRGESDKNKRDYLKGIRGIFKIKRYDIYVKLCDVPTITEEPAVTAYTNRNFKGDYFKFYRGETNNVGSDKEIETIKSLEIAPNTKVIFSDKEDCYHESEPNYGSIERSSDVTNALVVEGPAYISDLDKYLDSCYIDNGNLKTYTMQLKSFRVQNVKNTGKGFSIYKEKDGVGTFENIQTVLDNLKTEIRRYKVNERFDTIKSYMNDLLGRSFKNNNSKNVENDILSLLGIESIDDIDKVTIDDNLVGKKLNLSNYYPQSISIRGNYFVKLYDKNGKLSRTIIGPVENYNLRLDEENENKESGYSNSYNEYRLFTCSDGIDNIGVDIEQLILAYDSSYDKLTPKALEYLKEFCEAHKGTALDAANDERIKDEPTEEQSVRIISRDFLRFYKKKSKKFVCSAIFEKYKSSMLTKLNNNNDYRVLLEKYEQDKNNAVTNVLELMGGYENDIKNMYTKWQDMKLVINKLTQRDEKSRSLENVDGIVLYQAKDYNASLGGPENVWTKISKVDLVDTLGGNVKNFELSDKSGLNMEVEYDNINSIKIAGTITGSYQLVIKEAGGVEKKTRYSIPNLKEFFGKTDSDILKIVSIRLEEVAKTKDLEILLDTSGKSANQVEVKDFKIVNTTETKVQKEELSVKEEANTTERKVYMISLLDVLDSINASMEYLYKYDVTGKTDDELVGVKITRNIGDIGSTTPFKPGDNKETYKNIDKNIDDIVREIEIKFNKISIEDIFRNLEFTVSDEYEYTNESRGVIITDHGYISDENDEIKVDNAVVTRYYRDVLEVPPMFVKEDYREVSKNNEPVLENGQPKTVGYMRMVKEYEVGDGETKGKKFLFVPVCYEEGGKIFTSYLFEQLGIKATLNSGVIKLQY